MAYEQEVAFIKKLVEDQAADKLKALPKNDWGRLQNLGWEFGFNVTITDLKAVMPEQFYQDFGWDKPQLSGA